MADQQPEQQVRKEYQSSQVYRDTMYFVNGMVREFELYPEILDALRNGECSIELRKRIMLRAIDETWVTVIEDSLTALDEIIRRPSRFIEEEEQILPIELTKTITSRSIKHLSQHTDYISKADDDEIIPSKLLNVFREETLQTYENKFINTLINRLYAFVRVRYESALANGLDAKNTSVEFNNTFVHGEVHGKIHFRMELEEPPSEREVEKNYVLVSDLWKRVKRLNMICNDYVNSAFVREMGKSYIRPPVMRTNAIRKNKNLRQCLALWEFIESYENAGFSTLVDDTLLNLDEEYIRELYSTMAVEYIIFRNRINAGFDEDDELAHASIDAPLTPDIVEDLTPADVSEFALHIAEIDETQGERTPEETEVLRALEVALLADAVLRRRDEMEDLRDKYDRSFMARLILAQEPAQTFYTEIKNYLLSYKKVRNRISWKHESFTYGRNACARLAVKGKTLVIYLPLDPTAEEYQKYHVFDMSEFASYRKVPLGMKIRSRRAVTYAIRLITEVMERLGAVRDENAPQYDYHYPLETKEQLIARGLIKVNDKLLGSGELDDPRLIEGEKTDTDADVADTDDDSGRTMYNRSFMARLILAQEPAQTCYTAVKNCLLSYRKVKSRISWKYDTFNAGREICARLVVRGKTLILCLPLDPAEIDSERYHTFDLSEQTQYEKTPVGLKIRSARATKYAAELIGMVMQKLELPKREIYEPADYHLPLQDREELINQGLIKRQETKAKIFLKDRKESVTEPGTEPETETVTETVTEPVTETVTEPVAEAAEPMDGSAEQPDAQIAERSEPQESEATAVEDPERQVLQEEEPNGTIAEEPSVEESQTSEAIASEAIANEAITEEAVTEETSVDEFSVEESADATEPSRLEETFVSEGPSAPEEISGSEMPEAVAAGTVPEELPEEDIPVEEILDEEVPVEEMTEEMPTETVPEEEPFAEEPSTEESLMEEESTEALPAEEIPVEPAEEDPEEITEETTEEIPEEIPEEPAEDAPQDPDQDAPEVKQKKGFFSRLFGGLGKKH